MKNIDKKQFYRLLIAFVLGAFWLFAIRFVTVQKNEVHYHANFGVFIEGERLAFDNFIFYEEVESCGGDELNNPKIRGHMHDQENSVVHVHDNGVAWGHFFANLGMTAGDTLIKTIDETYVEDKNTEIRYLLNGEEVQTIANRTIENTDILLVSVGDASDDELQQQYNQIPDDAVKHNEEQDPASCSGGKPFTVTERLKAATGLFNE